jgi:putative membrane protein insertion efficiency factor
MSKTIRESEGSVPGGARIARALLLAPIALYRLTISPLLGVNCRHVPSCSDYAREAVDTNGAWKGGWLTLARLCRCHPWGSHGFDPGARSGAASINACAVDTTLDRPP